MNNKLIKLASISFFTFLLTSCFEMKSAKESQQQTDLSSNAPTENNPTDTNPINAVPQPVVTTSCTLDGLTLQNNEGAHFFLTPTIPSGSCRADNARYRICTNGILSTQEDSGQFNYSTCYTTGTTQPEPIPTPQPQPIPEPTPQPQPIPSNGFNFENLSIPIAHVGERYHIRKKIRFQTSSWSAGLNHSGMTGMRLQVSKDNKVYFQHELKENEFPTEINNPFNLSKHPDDLKNNHPSSTQLILPEGNYKIQYQNSSVRVNYPIVFSLLNAINAGYFVYYGCGLKHPDTLYHKQLNKGESLETYLNLYDNAGVANQSGPNRKRAVAINFIVDGKISLERFEVDFGNDAFQTTDYLRSVSAENNTVLKWVMEKDHSKFIVIEFFPLSNEFMVKAKNGIDVSEQHLDLSYSIFNEVNYGTNGVKFPIFKMTNNAGWDMKAQFGSIMNFNEAGQLLDIDASNSSVIPKIDGQYVTTKPWLYDCK